MRYDLEVVTYKTYKIEIDEAEAVVLMAIINNAEWEQKDDTPRSRLCNALQKALYAAGKP